MTTHYELRIYDHAEHWYFTERVQATTEAEARAAFRKNYGKGYRLANVCACGWSE